MCKGPRAAAGTEAGQQRERPARKARRKRSVGPPQVHVLNVQGHGHGRRPCCDSGCPRPHRWHRLQQLQRSREHSSGAIQQHVRVDNITGDLEQPVMDAKHGISRGIGPLSKAAEVGQGLGARCGEQVARNKVHYGGHQVDLVVGSPRGASAWLGSFGRLSLRCWACMRTQSSSTRTAQRSR